MCGLTLRRKAAVLPLGSFRPGEVIEGAARRRFDYGRLRLAYEASPIAMVVEQAGGQQWLPGGVGAEHGPQHGQAGQGRQAQVQWAWHRAWACAWCGCHHFTSMRAAAPSSASFGVWRPWVMASSAASSAGQKRPVSGMLGMGSPARTLAMVAAMRGSAASSA